MQDKEGRRAVLNAVKGIASGQVSPAKRGQQSLNQKAEMISADEEETRTRLGSDGASAIRGR